MTRDDEGELLNLTITCGNECNVGEWTGDNKNNKAQWKRSQNEGDTEEKVADDGDDEGRRRET